MSPREHDAVEVQTDCAAVRLIADIKRKHPIIEFLIKDKMWVSGKHVQARCESAP